METTASAIGFRFLLLTKGSGSVRAKPSHFARQCEYSARSAATLRAGAQSKRSKALKGCGGKQEFSPTSNTLSLLSQASETVRRTVSEEHYTFKL